MHVLQLVLAELEDLRRDISNLSERLGGNPLLLGLVLELNPLWLVADTVSQAGLREDEISPWGQWDLMRLGVIERWSSPLWTGDLKRRYRSADEGTRVVFGVRNPDYTPFLVKVIARPMEREISEQLGARSELLAVAAEAPFPAVVETRPLPRLVAKPGDRIQGASGARGTLGGFLQDRGTGEVFAATCGHVVSSGWVAKGGKPLGQCVHAEPPWPLQPGDRCYAQHPRMALLDLALISVPPGARIENRATSVAGVVYQHDIVEMAGASSGRQHYEVGGLHITYGIGGSCWGELFDLWPIIGPGILPAWFHLARAHPPANGDSGAWLLRHDSEWCGVVVAADHFRGFALSADAVLSRGSQQFNLQLG